MAVYTVHKRAEDAADSVRLVPDGFSLAAMAFTALWAMWRGLWIPALVLLALSAGLAVLPLDDSLKAACQIIVALLFGLEAYSIERWDLRRRGYAEIATVSGGSEEEAELAYFTVAPVASPAPAIDWSRTYRPADPLGLFGHV